MAAIDWAQFNENFQYYDKEIVKEVINILIDEYDQRIGNLKRILKKKISLIWPSIFIALKV